MGFLFSILSIIRKLQFGIHSSVTVPYLKAIRYNLTFIIVLPYQGEL